MTEYIIRVIDGHILIESCGDLLLVDTGSPISFHDDGSMTLCGRTFNVPCSLMNVNADYATRQLGVPVKGFVGMDYISAHPMSIDIEHGILAFDCDDTDGWTPIESVTIPGAVLMTMDVGGEPANVILDTGAPVSYISSKFTSGCESAGTVRDFSPFHPSDTFETETYYLRCSIADQDFRMRFGNLPGGLGMMLSMLGADGAVGMDMLRHFKVLISGGKVYVRSRQ